MKKDEFEREAKIIEIDFESVVLKLSKLGAKKVFDGEVRAVFMDTPDKVIKSRCNSLRVREKINSVDGKTITEVTLKGRAYEKDGVKIAQEYEFNSDSFEDTLEFFHKLGYEDISRILKRRISYVLDDVSFEIDIYSGIPPLLEIESVSVEKIKEYALKFGYSIDSLKSWSMKQLFKNYGQVKDGRFDF